MKALGRILLSITLAYLLLSCQQVIRDFTREAVLEVEGEFLYQDEIDNFIPANLSKEDSIYLVESYKKQWVTHTLLYKKAFNNIGNSASIKEQTESYRKELIINQYQQQLIAEKLGEVPEDSLRSYYESNKTLFLLDEAVIKGIFIKIPTSTSDQNELSQWLSNTTDENLENIMRYCTQHSVAYEFFLDTWTPYQKISALLPQKIDANDPILTRGTLVQQSEEYSYYLRITGKCDAGSPQPYEMIQPELYNILLNQEKIRFINQFQQELYQKAINEGLIIEHQTAQL